LAELQTAGLTCYKPQGAYYILCDIAPFGFPDDLAFTTYLIERVGVACVPGSAFGAPGYFRLSFAAATDTLRDALGRMQRALAGARTRKRA
jgi:aspartate aminotransferase